MASSVFLWGITPIVKANETFLWGITPIYTQGGPPPSFDTFAVIGSSFDVMPPFVTIKQLSPRTVSKITESLTVEREEPEQLWSNLESSEQAFFVEEKERISLAIQKFKDFLDAAEQIKEVLEVRLQHRKVIVDPTKRPDVIESIRRLFGKNTNVITYEMFKEALELRSKLITERRQNLNVTPNRPVSGYVGSE